MLAVKDERPTQISFKHSKVEPKDGITVRLCHVCDTGCEIGVLHRFYASGSKIAFMGIPAGSGSIMERFGPDHESFGVIHWHCSTDCGDKLRSDILERGYNGE